jgi:hypothetical protein
MVREERRPSSSGVTAGKGMGFKQIEEVSFLFSCFGFMADVS